MDKKIRNKSTPPGKNARILKPLRSHTNIVRIVRMPQMLENWGIGKLEFLLMGFG
ncbi:MAG: hypothetical protein SWX82_29145 [Cyanobacteriota bacterium]|nr:hypothetical protein [Cyanobacteriota bacterium]